MDLILIKMEKIADDFYEKLLNLISEYKCQMDIVSCDISEISLGDLIIIPSKHQVFLKKKKSA